MRVLLLSLFLLGSFGCLAKKSEVKATKIFEVEDKVIWGFSFINKKDLLFTTREGSFYYYNIDTKKQKKLSAPDVYAYGQGGLLDVKVFNIDGKKTVYLTYSTNRKGTATTALAKGIWNKGKIDGLKEIFVAKVKSDTTRHFGSRLAYDGTYLYMTIGDRGKRFHAQDQTLHNGSILRLTTDGEAAPDNPFKGKGLPEIYSYGHRNPQGIDYDEKRKILFSCEFGPQGGDELNIIKKGSNYGWPEITYGSEYGTGAPIGAFKKPGMEQPIEYWVPSISPSGLTLYYGDKIPQWKGNIFLANLSSTHLRRLTIKNKKVTNQEELFKDLYERIRHVEEGLDGYLYFSTDSGKFYRVELKS